MDHIQAQKYYPPLFLDYQRGTAEARLLYGHHYKESRCYAAKASFLRENFPEEKRKVLVSSLASYNRSLEAGRKTFENIELLAGQDTMAVVTGQQAGVLGGPLYTFYKGAAAVALAQKLSREFNTPVVPVFWIAAEDHDFWEVNHVYLQGEDGSPAKIELPPGSGPHALEHVSLDQEAGAAFLDEFAAGVPETEFKDEVLRGIREHMEKSDSLTRWFGRLMAWLFKDSGLVFFNPLMPGIRPLAAPVLAGISRKREEISAALKERDGEIQALGYPLQVKEKEGQLHLFAFLPGGRAALFWKGDGVFTRQGEDLGTLEEVAVKIAGDPGGYGPNVLTRPLVQEAFLPTLAYMGGPSEIAYFAQVAPLFHLFGMQTPVLYPRPSVTVLEPRMAKYADRYGLTASDLFRPGEALHAYLKGQGMDSVQEAFSEAEEKLREAYRGLKEKLTRVDMGLGPLTEKNLGRVLKEMAYLQGKGEQALKVKHKSVVRHFKNLENSCLPGGQLQERVYNIFFYLIKYGPEFVQDLGSAIPLDERHYIHRW